MRIKLLFLALGLWSLQAVAQPTGYYDGTGGKEGDELKTALSQIIEGQRQFSYFASKKIFETSDADPATPGNVILVYTGRSQDNADYGIGGDQINREHVWAKSHGNFNEVPPMYNDVHNLKPADASVNTLRSNKDFDNGGEEVAEAPGCFTTNDTWEPRDAVKGDIARIIFYMATRYEGNNGEADLKVVDYVNTYPNPEHGKLSTLLQWNELDPPDDFERNRNNVIFQWQKNRNPFIDNPEYANLIWGGAAAETIYAEEISQAPEYPKENETVTISASFASPGALTSVKIYWGNSYENLNNEIDMSLSQDRYTGEIPGLQGETDVFYKISASDGTNTTETLVYTYYVAPVFSGTLTTIYDIQGQTEVSPYEGQTVSTSGVVTANFGNNYFIQDGSGPWSGLFVFDANHAPAIGDSIIVTGKIEEYYEKTEIKEISGYYRISTDNSLPAPVDINTGDGGEQYEGVLVRVNNAVCTDDEYQANYYMWEVNDGSGPLKIKNTDIFEYEPVEGDSYKITGPLDYDFDEWKIQLRLETDVQSSSDIIPPQVNSLEVTSDTTLKITFSEDVTDATAENVNNYMINNDIEVLEAKKHAIQNAIVFLSVSKLSEGDYTITFKNIADEAGNVMEDTEQTFNYSGSGLEEYLAAGSIELYPNPAAGSFTIQVTAVQDTDATIRLYNVSGQKVYSTEQNIVFGNQRLTVNTDKLNSGIYLLQLTVEGYSISKKMLIQK